MILYKFDYQSEANQRARRTRDNDRAKIAHLEEEEDGEMGSGAVSGGAVYKP